MEIEPLSKMYKPGDFIFLDEVMNIIGERLYGEKWKNNDAIKAMPFIEKKRRNRDNQQDLLVEYYELKSGRIKRCESEFELDETLQAQLLEATSMASLVKERLWSNILSGHLSYQLRLKNKNVPSTHFAPKIWEQEADKIYTSGYFPTATKGKRQWGILLFKRQDALNCADAIASPSPLSNTIKQKSLPANTTNSESKFDPRERKSLQKILLVLAMKNYPQAMRSEVVHTIGKHIESESDKLGISIDSKTIASAIEKIYEMDEWKTVKKLTY